MDLVGLQKAYSDLFLGCCLLFQWTARTMPEPSLCPSPSQDTWMVLTERLQNEQVDEFHLWDKTVARWGTSSLCSEQNTDHKSYGESDERSEQKCFLGSLGTQLGPERWLRFGQYSKQKWLYSRQRKWWEQMNVNGNLWSGRESLTSPSGCPRQFPSIQRVQERVLHVSSQITPCPDW